MNAERTQKPAMASAAQRAFQPTTSSIPPPSSTRIVAAARACGIGRPLLAMEPASPSKPLILLNPDMMKINARRIRPTSAAQSYCVLNCADVVIGISAPGLVKAGRSGKVEQQCFGLGRSIAAVVERDLRFAVELGGVAGCKRGPVDGDRAADDVHVGATAGCERMDHAIAAPEDRGIEPCILVNGHRGGGLAGARDQRKLAALRGLGDARLRVRRGESTNPGLDPDLQKMHAV